MSRKTRFKILLPILLGGALAVGLASCAWLFNEPPSAAFTVGPSTAGQAPFEVTFSALLSSDPNGDEDIKSYAWNFGDGASGVGVSASHTYTAEGTYTVVLVVTDRQGDTDRTSKTIYVSPAELPGPTASFTASPASGSSPLSVRFDASASSYHLTPLTYAWDFGDGRTGSGQAVSHLYVTGTSETFTVTLTVRGPDGRTGTATETVTVTAAGGGGEGPTGSPSARFTVDDNAGVAPHRVELDPSDSEADEGRAITNYTWSLGDGEAEATVNPVKIPHTYITEDPSKIFSVTLVVIDNEGATDSVTKTVKVEDYQPVAGFEVSDHDNAKASTQPTQDSEWVTGETDGDGNDTTITYTGMTAGTYTVWLRSRQIADADWARDPDPDGDGSENPTPATKNDAPDEYTDHNMCFDPEGQTWIGGSEPSWFPAAIGQGWGIRRLFIDWGDATPDEEVTFVSGGDTLKSHVYTVDSTTETFKVVVTAEDYIGAKSSWTWTILMNEGGG